MNLVALLLVHVVVQTPGNYPFNTPVEFKGDTYQTTPVEVLAGRERKER